MKKTYRSRISIVLAAVLAVGFAAAAYAGHKEEDMKGLIVSIAIFVLIFVLLFSIKYVIDGETLKVYYFIAIHKDIDIRTITMMEPSLNPISAPAASLKRLAVYYGNNEVVYISPRRQDEFVEDINSVKAKATRKTRG